MQDLLPAQIQWRDPRRPLNSQLHFELQSLRTRAMDSQDKNSKKMQQPYEQVDGSGQIISTRWMCKLGGMPLSKLVVAEGR